MKERAQELKAEARLAKDQAAGEADVLAKIGEMAEPDRHLAQRLHELVKANAPTLVPRTWYGMPAYARDGKVLCFFQGAGKFGSRYATLGFSDQARLDEGQLWPTAFALTALGKAEEARVVALLKAALGWNSRPPDVGRPAHGDDKDLNVPLLNARCSRQSYE